MTDLDKMARELFEARLSPVLSQEGSFDADGDFVYNDDWVQGAWIGFRAALATPPAGYALVPVVPTDEMVDAASDAHMPFGDMRFAITSAILAAPEVK